MALWFFNKVVSFVLAAMLEGILLPSNMAAKTTFCLYLVKSLIVTLRCGVNFNTSSFQTFSLKFKCKICVQKEVIHNFKNHSLVTWPALNLLILRKWCGFEKPNHYYLVETWPANYFSKAKSYYFDFHKTMSHDLLVKMACWFCVTCISNILYVQRKKTDCTWLNIIWLSTVRRKTSYT